MKKASFILSLMLVLNSCTINAQMSSYDGKWEYVSYSSKDKETPQTVFTLFLNEKENNVLGWHCSVMQSGNRIDCSDNKAENSIKGIIKKDTLFCSFTSFFCDSVGSAIIYHDGRNLIWKITSLPNGKFYIPLNCSLTRIKDDVDNKITSSNAAQYNEQAYQLQQQGKNKEAADILEKIIQAAPDRVVTYLNLADSYWGLNKTQDAKKNYQKYIDLMKSQGKDLSRIPKRVYERVK